MRVKVSDYIIQLLEKHGVDTSFCITGGAAAHLLESLRTSNINVIHNYHEQASAMSAEGYARITKKPALVLITNGPGSTNAINGVLGAWQDSIPMIVISGQVPTNQTLAAEPRKIRQLGLQEADVISMVTYCTKYAIQLRDVSTIKYEIEKAIDIAVSGRPGPVWLDVPIDIQSTMIDTDTQLEYVKENIAQQYNITDVLLDAIRNAKKPLVVAGNGIHIASVENEFKDLVTKLNIPVICTWNATDLFDYNDPLYVGNFGLLGERAGNFAVQRADLLIVLGTRLGIPCIGYNTKDFAINAKKIMVDIDENEIYKHTLTIDYPVVEDLKTFIPALLAADINNAPQTEWTNSVIKWKYDYQVFNENHTRNDYSINSFDFIKELGNCLEENDIVSTDMGTSFTCTMQALRSIGTNRLFTSSGQSSMGVGLPGAIGAYVANKARTICIAGDGGIQMNIQELQTVVHYGLPIKIIILNNQGYLAISLMQDNLFSKNRLGADKLSGISSPNFVAVGEAYGIPSYKLNTLTDVKHQLKDLLKLEGPAIIEINMVKDQLIIPRVQSKRDAEGKIISGSLDMMFPFIDTNI
jgi:acetolactate synthase-1/2/3 large subunit